jgi:hypothetical protein
VASRINVSVAIGTPRVVFLINPGRGFDLGAPGPGIVLKSRLEWHWDPEERTGDSAHNEAKEGSEVPLRSLEHRDRS